MENFQTLADLILINDQNLADVDITDLLQDAPLLAALAAENASNGTQHKYVKETGAPVVGFRAPNTGRENDKSTDTLVTIALQIMDASYTVDKAVAMPYKKGPEAYVQRELGRHIKAAMFGVEQQLLYGTGAASADGFTGLTDAATLNALAQVLHVFNAAGTTANGASSVYAIRTNPDGTDCQVVTSEDGKIIVGETLEQRVEDIVNGGSFTGLYTSVLGWLGLQIGGIHSVKRLCNLTKEVGHTLTDDLLSEILALFPAARQPNLFVMSRQSRKQLQQSRTATNITGQPAPVPTEAFGVPIVVTDAIANTEAIVA